MPSNFYDLYLTETVNNHIICEEIEELHDTIECAAGQLNGLVSLDCFWQLEDPISFITRLEKALAPDATAIFIEPLLSPISYAFAKVKHPNDLNLKAKPYQKTGRVNFATPSLIFNRIENRIEFMKHFPNLTFDCRERIDLFTGLLPDNSSLLEQVKKIDDFLMPFIGNFAASHMKVILRKKA